MATEYLQCKVNLSEDYRDDPNAIFFDEIFNHTEMNFRGEYRDDPNAKRSMVRSTSGGGGYSGSSYDRWSYEQASR